MTRAPALAAAAVAWLVAACAPDGGAGATCGGDAGACATTCSATFAGNFAETHRAEAACPVLARMPGSADQVLSFMIDVTTLGSTETIAVDLGRAPAPGTSSSETLATWHAVGGGSIGDGACVYSAGDQVTPHGSFTLTLDAIEPATAHGVLDIVQYVHAVGGADCGDADTETIDLVF